MCHAALPQDIAELSSQEEPGKKRKKSDKSPEPRDSKAVGYV